MIEEPVYDEFLHLVVEQSRAVVVGNPMSLETEIGAVTARERLLSISDFVRTAVREGIEMLTDGIPVLEDTGGNHFAPTIAGNVPPENRLFREEIFGPVLTETRFRTTEEALALANGTEYGLSATVWTRSLSKAHKVIADLECGVVQVNSIRRIDNTAPLGGVKQSGNGVD